jgi:hydroxymethylbilane synthase
MKDGEYDGILVALAGLIRLNIDIPHQILTPPLFVPSANQGIIAVAVREGEEDLVSFMNHRRTYLCATAEREVLREIGIGCTVPAGILTDISGNRLSITCEILRPGGEEVAKLEREYELEYEDGFGECRKSDIERVKRIAKEFSKELKTRMA